MCLNPNILIIIISFKRWKSWLYPNFSRIILLECQISCLFFSTIVVEVEEPGSTQETRHVCLLVIYLMFMGNLDNSCQSHRLSVSISWCSDICCSCGLNFLLLLHFLFFGRHNPTFSAAIFRYVLLSFFVIASFYLIWVCGFRSMRYGCVWFSNFPVVLVAFRCNCSM